MSNKKVITIYEDRQAQLELNDRQLEDIISLKEIIGSNNISVQVDGRVLIKHYVGFFSTRNISVQVLPKIYRDDAYKKEKNKEKNEAIGLLFKLLNYSGFLGIKELPQPQFIDSYDNYFLEIFIAIFINRFLRLFSFSMHKRYEISEENMQFIKGKILFQENLKKNLFKRHLHYVQYDEFTENTLLNKIFKTIILKLLKRTKNSDNKRKLKLL